MICAQFLVALSCRRLRCPLRNRLPFAGECEWSVGSFGRNDAITALDVSAVVGANYEAGLTRKSAVGQSCARCFATMMPLGSF